LKAARVVGSLIKREEEVVREQIQARLEVLKSELEAGEAELAKVEKQRAYLGETMLRISGAIQVLEEVLAEEEPTEHPEGTNLSKTSSEPAKTQSIGVRSDWTDQATYGER
jgi:predicted nuclease with TOPRIM domain